MAETAVSTTIDVVEKVIRFLIKEVEHTFGTVDDIKSSLSMMRAFLQDADGSGGGERINDVIKQIRQVANDIEDVLDEFMIHAPHEHFPSNNFFQRVYVAGHNIKHWMPVHDIQSRMQNIRNTIGTITAYPVFSELVRRISDRSLEGSSSSKLPFFNHDILEEDEIFGIDEAKIRLSNQLLSNWQKQRRVLAVVGPAGSGKTVLVNSVFRSKQVLGEFDCCAWVTVSHSLSSCADVNYEYCQSLRTKNSTGGDEQAIPLADLGKHLKGKRYIVVLDNVSNEQQWRVLEQVLPNEPNGNSIIITTTSSLVANSSARCADYVHEIDGLPWKESWLLFCKKAFRANNGKCPPELEDLAQKIVKRCEGSPLAITAVGSLLSRKPSLPSEFEKVHDNLGPEIVNGTSNHETISKMLLPSYKDLPSNLKSCFLYFSIFPEDYSVDRERLIRLWVAEGFVKRVGRKTLEEVAEEYLNELIIRNLVHPSCRDFDGRVKSCRVLNLVREFLILKSEDENFAVALSETDNIESSEKVRRLSLHDFDLERIEGKADILDRVRTLSIFGSCKLIPSHIRMMHDQLKLLRVLDLQYAPLQQFPESICELTLLRYLSLRHTSVKHVPASIQALRYLEYLDLKQTKVTQLPKGICSLRKLRHLLVYNYYSSNNVTFNIQGVEVVGNMGALQALQKLTLVRANNCQKFFEELGHLHQLQKLGLYDLMEKNGKHLCDSIQKMKNLRVADLRSNETQYLALDYMAEVSPKLQRLYLKGCLRSLPLWVNQSLTSLVRVHLKWSRLTTSPIDTLQKLPNLVELRMVDAFMEQVLMFETDGFQKLKILHIEQFQYLSALVVCCGAMPKLQKLTITRCANLRTLPMGIEHLTMLEELYAYDMPPGFTAKLKRGSADRELIKQIVMIYT